MKAKELIEHLKIVGEDCEVFYEYFDDQMGSMGCVIVDTENIKKVYIGNSNNY